MTELTTGQRIAQCRKALSLSQEGLGEKLGVSRQAISKWEADAAMPDIDKLIALSRLFGVSVGWLLGVEEQPEPQPESSQLSEELLHKIEEVVQQYQPRKKRSPWKIAATIAAAALLLWGGVKLGREWQYTRNQVSHLSVQLQSSSQQNSRILSQLDSLENRINSINDTIEREAASLASYEFKLSPSTEEQYVRVELTVIPKSWNEEWTATWHVRHQGALSMTQQCHWDGAALNGALNLNYVNDLEYYLVISYPDGTQEQVKLEDSAAENLRRSFSINCHISPGNGYFSLKNNILTLEGCVIGLAPPSLVAAQDIGWTAELTLYHIRDGQRQIADTEVLIDPETLSTTEEGTGIQILESTLYPKGPFQLPELEDGDSLELWLTAEMENGISLEHLVSAWVYQDGDFVSGVPLE